MLVLRRRRRRRQVGEMAREGGVGAEDGDDDEVTYDE